MRLKPSFEIIVLIIYKPSCSRLTSGYATLFCCTKECIAINLMQYTQLFNSFHNLKRKRTKRLPSFRKFGTLRQCSESLFGLQHRSYLLELLITDDRASN